MSDNKPLTDSPSVSDTAKSIKVVRTPDRYVWECAEGSCRFVASNEDRAATKAARQRHEAMHRMAVKGKRVRIIRESRTITRGHTGDTGRITYAYLDQNRFGVRLDRKGKCIGCDYCDGCGGPRDIDSEHCFDDLEILP